MQDIKFIEFVWVWNKHVQGFSTPLHHKKMSAWLADLWKGKCCSKSEAKESDRKGVLLAFRNSGKSTIVGLFCAWTLLKKPQTRILVLAADHELAKKMVRNVKRIIEKHPLTKQLKPKSADQWAQEQFTVNRAIELRDPSMLAKGLGANITGSRADIIICDDVEVPNTCDTPTKREDLRTRLQELDFVLVPNGMQLYIGTPHTYYSIYKEGKSAEIKDEGGASFLHGFSRMEIPVYKENGQSQWPERFSVDMIEAIRQRSGDNKFASQMMLTPVNIADGRLNPDDMNIYDEELEFIESNGHVELRLRGKRLVSASCWWDPAYGSPNKGDSSVVACVFTDESGAYWLHRVKYIETSDSSDDDEATQQCKVVAEFAKEYALPSIRIEVNGLGRFLPSLLRREISGINYRCPVIEEFSSRPKHLRIIEAFDAVLAAGALNCHKDVYCSNFVSEMREWQPIKSNLKDDGLDAVAGCLSSEPVRLQRLSTNCQPQINAWKNKEIINAAVNFNL
ncbi:MAG: phage terminase large subunit [Alphaproteobacteria bacterium]|nr:phage terminase large subunit [Alphaproteobacteria bacterium]